MSILVARETVQTAAPAVVASQGNGGCSPQRCCWTWAQCNFGGGGEDEPEPKGEASRRGESRSLRGCVGTCSRCSVCGCFLKHGSAASKREMKCSSLLNATYSLFVSRLESTRLGDRNKLLLFSGV